MLRGKDLFIKFFKYLKVLLKCFVTLMLCLNTSKCQKDSLENVL